MAWTEEDKKAVRALSEERGGQLLKQHCEAEIERIDRGWLRLLSPGVKSLPDEQLLYLQLLKNRADKEAYRRIASMMTDPSKERDDE